MSINKKNIVICFRICCTTNHLPRLLSRGQELPSGHWALAPFFAVNWTKVPLVVRFFYPVAKAKIFLTMYLIRQLKLTTILVYHPLFVGEIK